MACAMSTPSSLVIIGAMANGDSYRLNCQDQAFIVCIKMQVSRDLGS